MTGLESLRIRVATPADLAGLAELDRASDLPSVGAEQLAIETAAGRTRPEWSWLAEDDDGRLIGRALWWGHADGQRPVALDALDVVGPARDRVSVATWLLREGHRAVHDGGSGPLPEYLLKLPTDWAARPDVRAAVDWRIEAAERAGLSERNERLQMEWRAGSVEPGPAVLGFRPGDETEFLGLFARVAVGSLDVTTRRALATMSPGEQARDDYEFYRDAPGERDWWRIAVDDAGSAVGFVIPSATPTSCNVGYLGVLPEHRGRGLVDELLAEAVRLHCADGADRITATTDVVNTPMAAAFARAGFTVTERRLVLEEPRGLR